MNYYLLIPLVIIFLMFIPIHLEVRFGFNFQNFSGAVGIFLFKFKILHRLIWIKNKKIIARSENKVQTQEIEFNGKEVIFLETLTEQIKGKTKLRKMSIYYNFGLDDAFATCYFCGIINFFLTIFFAKIKSQTPTATLELNDTISYNRFILQTNFIMHISISLFDIVYSLLCSVILTRKKEKLKDKKLAKSQPNL